MRAKLKSVMKLPFVILNCAVSVFLSIAPLAAEEVGEENALDKLFIQLAEPDQTEWKSIEEAIWRNWSDSGSASMNLLLQRGRQALSVGNTILAIEHFTALIDHAPDFAEGWNMRATAYFGAGKYGLSIADVQRTLALNPRHFGALQGLARMLEEMNDFDNALTALRAAYAIHPHRPGIKEGIERLERKTSGRDL